MTDSLARCVIKKTLAVWKKIALAAGALIAAVFAYYGIVALYTIDAEPIAAFFTRVGVVASQAWTFATTALPWPYNAIVGAAVALLLGSIVYAWAWCVAREFTDEDWQSDSANDIGFLLWLWLWLWLGLWLWLWLWLGLWLGLGLGLALGLWLWLNETKTFHFLGAYLHYRARIAKEREGK